MDRESGRVALPYGGVYQASNALSVLGNSIAAVVLPLLVLQTTGSVMSAGILALATGVPQFLAAVFGGVVLDRVNRQTVAVAGDVLSALAIAGIGLLNEVDGISLSWYVFLGFVSAVGDVPALTARETMVPALAKVTGRCSQTIVGVREAISAACTVIGPGAAAGLILLGNYSIALLVTALTSGLAAALTSLLPKELGSNGGLASGSTSFKSDFLDGVRYLLKSSKVLRAVTIVGAVLLSSAAAVQAVVLPVYFIRAGTPARAGLTMSMMAVGMMIGAGTYAALRNRAGSRETLRLGILISTAGVGTLVLTENHLGTLLSVAILGVGIGVSSALIGVVTLECSATSMQGRVLGNQNAVGFIAGPLATLLAATTIERYSTQSSLAVIALLFGVIFLWSLVSRTIQNLDVSGTGNLKSQKEVVSCESGPETEKLKPQGGG